MLSAGVKTFKEFLFLIIIPALLVTTCSINKAISVNTHMQTILFLIFYSLTITSVPLLVYSVRTKKFGWAYVSIGMSSPICLFIGGYPGLFYIPILFPIGLLLGVACIKKQRSGFALLFFIPYLMLWVGAIVVALINLQR